MKAIAPRIIPPIFLALFVAAATHAGTLTGTVVNRTTGKPAPYIDLSFLSPTQGLRDLGSAKSDAEGHFTLTNEAAGITPILIRATYHDVSFNTFAPPGRPVVEVEIFDISKDPKTVSVASHIVIFEPRGEKLIGAEEYEVENTSQPAFAYFQSGGNFDFPIPENGKLGQVSTVGEMGMSVNQASIEKGKGHYAIAYTFRPGQTNVRLSYELPYSGSAATVKLPAPLYANVKMLVVVPPGVTVAGEGLNAAGTEQGMIVYTHDPIPAKGLLTVKLSGQGSTPAESGNQVQSAPPPQEGNSRTGGPEVIAAPSRLDDFKWYVFGGMALLFAMGAILLSRKQVVVAVGPQVESDEDKLASAKLDPPSRPAVAPPVSQPANSNKAAASIDHQVAASLDSLKDQIFRLELRRQAGTISEEDYAREKAQVDQLLRDLVKG
jgi:hypothetical protein